MKNLLVLIISFYSICNLFAQDNSNKKDKDISVNTDSVITENKVDTIYDETPYLIVDEPATFKGGDLNTFREYLMEHLVYPPDAEKARIEGRVIIQFVVNSQGFVIKPKILNSVYPSIDEAAAALLKGSPKWVPAKTKRKKVSQQFVIPIQYKLK